MLGAITALWATQDVSSRTRPTWIEKDSHFGFLISAGPGTLVGDSKLDMKESTVFQVGMVSTQNISPYVALEFGVQPSLEFYHFDDKSEQSDTTGGIDWDLDYSYLYEFNVNIPILLRLRMGPTGLFGLVGPQPTINLISACDADLESKRKDNTRDLRLSGVIGMGYQFTRFFLEARGRSSLIAIYQDTDLRSMDLQFAAGFLF